MAARAFMTIACILSALSVIGLFTNLKDETSSNQMMVTISKVLVVVCFVVGLIGVAVGISFTTYGGGGSLGAAIYLGIIALVVNLTAAGLASQIR
jgi:hypothetical protein